MKKVLSFLALLPILLALLNGCASFYDVAPDKAPTAYSRPSIIDTDFNISGRFIIKQPEKNDYGNFTWSKSGESEELDFNTPIGQTVATIKIESNVATLTTKDKSYTGNDLDEMMQKQLGFILPMNYLHYWIQGVSLPDVQVTQNISDGFIQLGWKVEYLEWKDQNHPQIIQCSKDNLVIKLLIEW